MVRSRRQCGAQRWPSSDHRSITSQPTLRRPRKAWVLIWETTMALAARRPHCNHCPTDTRTSQRLPEAAKKWRSRQRCFRPTPRVSGDIVDYGAARTNRSHSRASRVAGGSRRVYPRRRAARDALRPRRRRVSRRMQGAATPGHQRVAPELAQVSMHERAPLSGTTSTDGSRRGPRRLDLRAATLNRTRAR